MPTKVVEPCPTCGADTMPTDRAVAVESEFGPAPMAQWRYECGACGWSWANLAQRKHNDQLYTQWLRRLRQRGWE